ncbi:FAD-binding oxidoreductase [Paenibacillus sp. PAMC21692]|uniref:NAD(P)/FAD-dependent oxidoreductase n=1 Tax=Paenibacillus sp. PAMC21692 TaxID=2762320 RepID=UPI00164DD9FE|nr:FAD-binding oxidoreductase [Paenibacillus sp. PAMC21692]QNK60545.1 FAD-binding oxidoreductase [Paenibacillus sp. PAMC21692]
MMKCIVIGAGIAGASTAYHLAKLGAETLIIDRKDKGQATDAAAGIICPWVSQRRNAVWYRLVKNGASFYPGLIRELEELGETETGYSRVGALHLRQDAEKLSALESLARKRKEDAPEIGEIDLCDEEMTLSQFPPLAEGSRSVRISGAARVDGRALRDALIRAAVKLGAHYREGSAALAFEGSRVIGATIADASPVVDSPETARWKHGSGSHPEQDRFVAADAVIVCAGAWAGPLLQPLGITMRVSRQKAQIAHLRLQDRPDTGSWPVVMPPSDQYMLAFDGGKIVVGATHENDPDGDDTRVTAGGLQEILNKALVAAPGLANAELVETRVGFRPFTPGFLPVFGAVPGWEGLLTANGLGSSGLTAGPYLGCQLALLALGRQPELDPADYDVRSAIK